MTKTTESIIKEALELMREEDAAFAVRMNDDWFSAMMEGHYYPVIHEHHRKKIVKKFKLKANKQL